MLLQRCRRCMPVAAFGAFSLLSGCSAEGGGAAGDNHAHSGYEHVRQVVGGDPAQGRALVANRKCGVCHLIPGIAGAHGIVGPPLGGFASRQFIGGVVPNEPATLIRWVQDPPSIAPHTAMPSLALTGDEARHVAAYLYTLK